MCIILDSGLILFILIDILQSKVTKHYKVNEEKNMVGNEISQFYITC